MRVTSSPSAAERGSSSPVLWAAAIMVALSLLLFVGGGVFWRTSVHVTPLPSTAPAPALVVAASAADSPAGLPAWVPVPASSEGMTAVTRQADASSPAVAPAFTFSTVQTPEEMTAFYRKELAAAGLVADTGSSAPADATLHATDAAAGRSVGVSITPVPGGTGSIVVLTPVEKPAR